MSHVAAGDLGPGIEIDALLANRHGDEDLRGRRDGPDLIGILAEDLRARLCVDHHDGPRPDLRELVGPRGAAEDTHDHPQEEGAHHDRRNTVGQEPRLFSGLCVIMMTRGVEMDPQAGPSSPDHIIGQTVGNYLVTQKLGEGGMGSVYLAEHPTIGKKVALKVLHAEFASNPEVADRFFTEAKAVNAIGHPNIVDIVDYGVLQRGPGGRDRLVYFIMEYLNGLTLSQVIRTEAPLPPERALTIALQVADSLAASHKANIVHRDLKPDNIILIQRGRERDFVKLLDFGIAKLTGSDGLSSHKTRTGLVLGTPAYMSPEQCEGRATVDHRTDIYALGVVLYEMITGRVPFIGEGYGEILVQHLTQQPVPPSQYRMMSPHVEQVVLKALEKRPDMRYPNMDEFMRAMSDPVGYVEAHGGVGGFLGKQLMPSSAPLPPVRLTPAPMTPVPGLTPAPGSLTAGMTTPTPAPGMVT